MRGVCLFVLALAVVTAEEGKPPMLGPDVKLMAQCTDSLTTLMNNKAKVIQGLNGITSKVADQSKPAKTKAESKAQPAKPAAKKSEANKPPAKPAELGEGGEVGRNWPGLKSMSRKDIKQFLDDVGHLAVQSTKLLKAVDQSRTDIHVTEPKKGEVVMLGDEAPQAPQDKAAAKADAKKPKSIMPSAQALPDNVNHMKHLIDHCVANVVKVSASLTAVEGYAKCLKSTKPTADNMWPNVKECTTLKPSTVVEPKPKKANTEAKAKTEAAAKEQDKAAAAPKKDPEPAKGKAAPKGDAAQAKAAGKPAGKPAGKSQ